MSDDVSYLRIPRKIAKKLDKRAKRKDSMKEWSQEAREILAAAVANETEA